MRSLRCAPKKNFAHRDVSGRVMRREIKDQRPHRIYGEKWKKSSRDLRFSFVSLEAEIVYFRDNSALQFCFRFVIGK